MLAPVASAKEHHPYRSPQWYDAQTNLAFRWLNERESVEARVRDNHTNDENGSVNEKAIELNLSHIARLVYCVMDADTCAD